MNYGDGARRDSRKFGMGIHSSADIQNTVKDLSEEEMANIGAAEEGNVFANLALRRAKPGESQLDGPFFTHLIILTSYCQFPKAPTQTKKRKQSSEVKVK